MNSACDGLVLLAIPIMFVIGLRRPDWLLLIWLALSPLQNDTIFFGVNFRVVSFDRLACITSIVSLMAGGRLMEAIPKRLSNFEKTALVFLAVFLIEALFTADMRDAFSLWTQATDLFGIPLYLYFLLRYLLLREGTYDDVFEGNLATTLAIVALYCACMGIFEQATKFDILDRSARGLRISEDGDSLRANGPFAAPGVLGLYLNLTTLFIICRWRMLHVLGVKLKRWKAWPFSILMAGGIYSVMFRNMWGGFIGGYVIQTVLNPRFRGKFAVGLVVLGLVGASAWGVISQTDLYQERITNVSNIHDRLNAWAYAFRALSEHPLMGIGYGGLKFYIRGAQERGDDLRWFEDTPATYHPHNTVIAMLGENGLLLTIPFLLMIFQIVQKAWQLLRFQTKKVDREFAFFACGALFALLAPHMTDRCFAWAKYNNLLFILFGLIAARHVQWLGGLQNRSEPNSTEGSSEQEHPQHTTAHVA